MQLELDEQQTLVGIRFCVAAQEQSWRIEYKATRSRTVGARIDRFGHILVAGSVDDVAACHAALRRWLARYATSALAPWLENLADLRRAVRDTGAELGLAFDGDGDRLGVVTRDGEIIYPDRQLMLFAADVLTRDPGAQIIHDVKCSRWVAESIRHQGGRPLMWNTGHALIKTKLRETGAPLAGEMSGHMFFKERWYGFDDALYTGTRLLEIVSRWTDSNWPLKHLPNAISTPELNIKMNLKT